MVDLGDIKLDRGPADATADDEARSARRLIIGAALLVAAAAVAFYFILHRNTQPEPSATRAASSVVGKAADPSLRAEPGENLRLPPLNEMDPAVRELVRQLSLHPTIAAWLAGDDLVRNFTVVVTSIAVGRTPVRHLRRLAPEDEFLARGIEPDLTVDPRSYARYDVHADAIGAVDARGAARLYATLKPRIAEAYVELGEAEPDFDRVLERAIVELLRAPALRESGPVRLTPRPMAYAYADPKLESLSPAQKQLLRMGPHNAAIVQDKLREIAAHLGIPSSRLP
ncbi:MAG TPA: DUF3014 domain-containing protein [Vicinamibacterales bacterium]|nr:DUF3014 domain-containing protein [Vicinamibacterales bacterium]